MSAFSAKNRRVGFSNEKSTCRLFQRKIDVSAFSTRPTIWGNLPNRHTFCVTKLAKIFLRAHLSEMVFLDLYTLYYMRKQLNKRKRVCDIHFLNIESRKMWKFRNNSAFRSPSKVSKYFLVEIFLPVLWHKKCDGLADFLIYINSLHI